jgi:type II secretory pathway component GspD/PulD (secretin)
LTQYFFGLIKRDIAETWNGTIAMKNFPALLFATGILFLVGGCATPTGTGYKPSYSSFDQPADHPSETPMTAGSINFQGVELKQVLDVYAAVSGRTVIRGTLPDVKISVRSSTPLTKVQIMQTLDSVLAQNGIAMVLSGDHSVKAVTTSQATSENPPEITLPWKLLPESSSPMTRTVTLKYLKPSEVVPALMPFAKLPNSILAIDGEKLLILRDYSENIRKQLQLLEQLDRQPVR